MWTTGSVRLKQDESYDDGSRLVRALGRREVSACKTGRIRRPEKPGEAPEDPVDVWTQGIGHIGAIA